MRKFLHKKWLSIPVIVVLVLALTAGSVMAAYSFLGFTTEISVAEPMSIEWKVTETYGGDNIWRPLTGGAASDELTLELSAGDIFRLDLQFLNIASEPLTINTVVTGGGGWIETNGFPEGLIVDGGDWEPGAPSVWKVVTDAEVIVRGDAPAPATYNVTFTFTRQ